MGGVLLQTREISRDYTWVGGGPCSGLDKDLFS